MPSQLGWTREQFNELMCSNLSYHDFSRLPCNPAAWQESSYQCIRFKMVGIRIDRQWNQSKIGPRPSIVGPLVEWCGANVFSRITTDQETPSWVLICMTRNVLIMLNGHIHLPDHHRRIGLLYSISHLL